MWDTFGFPLDLTQVLGNTLLFCRIYFSCMSLFAYNFSLQLMAEEEGLLVDVEGFNVAMDEARERSRNAQNKVVEFLRCLSHFRTSTFFYL